MLIIKKQGLGLAKFRHNFFPLVFCPYQDYITSIRVSSSFCVATMGDPG